ncbi:MAG: biotin--[acetyl-CoA-carboxylase] ligase [Chitinophagales bacterium]
MYSSYQTLFFGKHLHSFDQIDSTNNYAQQLLIREKPPEGTAIVAKYQTAGRGQRGNVWQSKAGQNIAISFVLYPQFITANHQFYFNQAIAFGVYEFAKEVLGEGVKIKWPNDIYYKKSKLGGILIENSIMGNHLNTAIVGIGINVNQTTFETHLPNPISMQQVTGKNYEIKNLIKKLCYYLEVQYLQLKTAKLTSITQQYHEVLYQKKEWHTYKDLETGQVFKGKIEGVTPFGKLILQTQTANGIMQKKVFAFKEVAYC